MGLQVVKQEKDVYAIWTTYSDSFVALDQTRQQIIDFFMNLAANRAKEEYESLIDAMEEEDGAVSNKKRRQAFYDPPTMSFEQRLEKHAKMENNLNNATINALVHQKLKELGR